MKRYLRHLRKKSIDVLVFRMIAPSEVDFPAPEFDVRKVAAGSKTKYFIDDNGVFVHNSFLFPELRLLGLLGKRGPAIGECVTNPEYRGKSIYPFVINKIAKEVLRNGAAEVFIVVNSDNVSSIRGIEKAGFDRFARIRAIRQFGMFRNVKIDWF